MRSLTTGTSGLQQFQQQIDVIGNNIANADTVGFKKGRADFADTFSQFIQGGTSGASCQVGSGVDTGAIQNVFTAGTIATTGVPTDVAISGDGFFVVKDSNGNTYATRDGAFQWDSNGNLTTASTGMIVQSKDGTAINIGTDVASVTISDDGTVTATTKAGATVNGGQIGLQSFSSPQALQKQGGNLFSWDASAGPLAQASAPKTNGLGTLKVGSRELSNVDLTSEFSSLITAQRAFQANARMITTSDEVLQEIVNLKR